jgi:hypothetical protein
MTEVLLIITLAGTPVIVGRFATSDDCRRAIRDNTVVIESEVRGEWKPYPGNRYCVRVPK